MAILLVFGVMIVFQSTHRPKKKTPKRRTDKTDVTRRMNQQSTVRQPNFTAVPAVRARVVQNGDRTHEIVANLKEFPSFSAATSSWSMVRLSRWRAASI